MNTTHQRLSNLVKHVYVIGVCSDLWCEIVVGDSRLDIIRILLRVKDYHKEKLFKK